MGCAIKATKAFNKEMRLLGSLSRPPATSPHHLPTYFEAGTESFRSQELKGKPEQVEL